eukprot:TRINITY_DN1469_c0_g1_i1.p1 TRINITY_DN1469_c0_g1~~TRINITY_DN1469_c0_g1_i1.p1  ORF type:complete len:275 (+),score=64.16 TRINITY_DN1469_c0_g1_i1:42-866(+)
MGLSVWTILAVAVSLSNFGLAANVGNWSVDNCIYVEMALNLNIFPDPKDKNVTITVDVPAEALGSGKCSETSENKTKPDTDSEILNLQWEETDKVVNKPLNRYLNLTFKMNDTVPSPFYGLYRLDGYYETRYFDKNITDDSGNTSVKQFIEYVSFSTYKIINLEFPTPVNMTYMCQNVGVISMHSELHDTSEAQGASGEMLPNVTFTATNVKLNAFRPINITPGDFQTFLDCSARPSDVVPIIVGCALAGTVLLVLVAYLVGRRRNRAAGYQSV